MRKVLLFLAELSDQDLDWFSGAGVRELIRKGQVLIRQGLPLEALYVVLRGGFTVSTQDGVVGTSGQGELLGEISFVDGSLPTATVTASEDSSVLAIPRTRLHSKLQTDETFASHVYRAVEKIMAHRLRDHPGPKTSRTPENLDRDEDSGEFDEETLDKISLAAVRFETLLARAGR